MATVAYQVGTKSVSRSGRDGPICSPKPCEALPPDTLLDGEIVAIDRDGRVSFNLMRNSRSKVPEAAELLQVSPRTVQRMIWRKELPAFKVGNQWRVNESALVKWLQER